MKNLFKSFRDKYKVSKIPVVSETKVSKNEEAKQLAMKLNMLFVAIPLMKPYNGDINKVKLLEEHINVILDVLNSQNELIKNSEYYDEVKSILEEILDNNQNGIEINNSFISKARRIQIFYYSFQDEKYWKEKPL